MARRNHGYDVDVHHNRIVNNLTCEIAIISVTILLIRITAGVTRGRGFNRVEARGGQGTEVTIRRAIQYVKYSILEHFITSIQGIISCIDY